jgi:hypothetical protein
MAVRAAMAADGHVVENAVAHGPGSLGMVAGRTRQHQGMGQGSGDDLPDRLDGSADGHGRHR